VDDSDRDRLREIQDQFMTEDPGFVRVFHTVPGRTWQERESGAWYMASVVTLLMFSMVFLLGGVHSFALLLLVLVMLVWKARDA